MADISSLPTSTTDPALPQGLNAQQIARDLQKDGVSAPSDVKPAIMESVAQAQAKGVDLKVVYYPQSGGELTAPRNLAELLRPYVDGTILVINKSHEGTTSNVYPRYLLESAEHNMDTIVGAPDLYAAQPVVQVDTFVRDVSGPSIPWGPVLGSVLMTTVLSIAVVTVAFKRRLHKM